MMSAQAAEARGVIQGIRNAEEAYKAETLVYLGCTTNFSPLYPMTMPNDQKSNWDNPGAAQYNCWKQLNVITDGPVRFGYAVDAGLGGAAIPAPPVASKPTWPTTTDPWYVVLAQGDRDKDGVNAYFLASSFSGEIYFENDTE
jgi:type IV pilus assembly protein PilA